MKVTFTEDGGFEIDYTPEELSGKVEIPESAYDGIFGTIKERLHVSKELCIRNMELSQATTVKNMELSQATIIRNMELSKEVAVHDMNCHLESNRLSILQMNRQNAQNIRSALNNFPEETVEYDFGKDSQ